MATITFSQAAQMMGWRSRSTLYRLRDSGALLGYVRESAKGGTVLEMTPPNRPPLDEHLRRVVRTQANSPGRRTAQQQAPDPPAKAERELATMRQLLAAARAREQAWVQGYSALRCWVSEQASLELHRQLGDQPAIGDVMVTVRQMLLARLKPLDAAELDSRFPR